MEGKQLNNLLTKEVDRKEFLVYLGLFLLAAVGVSNIIKSFSTITQEKQQNGFGSGPYGI